VRITQAKLATPFGTAQGRASKPHAPMEVSARNGSYAVTMDPIVEQYLGEAEITSLRLFIELLACWDEEAQ